MLRFETENNIFVMVHHKEDLTGGNKPNAPVHPFVIELVKGFAEVRITDWLFDGKETVAKLDVYLFDEPILTDIDLDELAMMSEFMELAEFAAATDWEEVVKPLYDKA